MRNNDLDEFDPRNLVGTPEQVTKWQKARAERRIQQERAAQETFKNRSAPTGKESGLQFYRFPRPVIQEILKTSRGRGSAASLVILFVLYELWFTHRNYNPVMLTSHSLRQYGITRDLKCHALKLLEKSGQVLVDRSPGRNSWVTLKWLPPKNDPSK
jgi:hypothetical protein